MRESRRGGATRPVRGARRWGTRRAGLLAVAALSLGLGTPASAAVQVLPGPARLARLPVRITAPTLPLWASGANFRWISRILWEPQHGGHVVETIRGFRVAHGRFEVWTPALAPGWYRLVIDNKYGMSNRPWVRVYPTERFRAPWSCPATWGGYSVQGDGGLWITCRRIGATGRARWVGDKP
jgi:hypothetical protein